MKRVSKLIVYGLVIVGMAIAIVTTNIYPLPSWATAIAQQTQTETTSPKRLNIAVNMSANQMTSKSSEGERVEKGEIIADRERERTRLTSPTETATVIFRPTQSSFDYSTSSTPISAVPPTMALPPISYLEQEAAVAKTKSAAPWRRINDRLYRIGNRTQTVRN